MVKGHRTEWKIFDRLKFIFCTEKIEFYFTLKNRNYFLANPIHINGSKSPFRDRIQMYVQNERFSDFVSLLNYVSAVLITNYLLTEQF